MQSLHVPAWTHSCLCVLAVSVRASHSSNVSWKALFPFTRPAPREIGPFFLQSNKWVRVCVPLCVWHCQLRVSVFGGREG